MIKKVIVEGDNPIVNYKTNKLNNNIKKKKNSKSVSYNGYKIIQTLEDVDNYCELKKDKNSFDLEKEFLLEKSKLKIEKHFIDFNNVDMDDVLLKLLKIDIFLNINIDSKFFVMMDKNIYNRIYSFCRIYKLIIEFSDCKYLLLSGFTFKIIFNDNVKDYMLFGQYSDLSENLLVYIENDTKCGIFKIGDENEMGKNYCYIYPYSEIEYKKIVRKNKINKIAND